MVAALATTISGILPSIHTTSISPSISVFAGRPSARNADPVVDPQPSQKGPAVDCTPRSASGCCTVGTRKVAATTAAIGVIGLWSSYGLLLVERRIARWRL